MIAAIYPNITHPDSKGRPVRYFDIRKLTEGECLRLMDVSEPDIRTLVDSPLLSKSAIYKLAGNSIVVSCLYHIFRNIWLTEPKVEPMSLFPEPTFRADIPSTFHIVTLFSGYDSQLMAMQRIADEANRTTQGGQKHTVNLAAWAEFDPESKRPLAQQPAVIAHNLLFPQYKGRNLGDVTKVDWQKVKDEMVPQLADIDLLTYSSPCQSISNAGKRAGIAKGSGTRSATLWYVEEAIRVLRPKFLLQENVKALCNKVNRPHFEEWQQVCQALGYTNYWAVLNAKDYGVPQNRERVFMLSVRNDLNLPTYRFPEPIPLTKVVADELQEDVSKDYFLRPEGVIKFLQRNSADQGDGIIYTITDHFLTDEEIIHLRNNPPSDQDSGSQANPT